MNKYPGGGGGGGGGPEHLSPPYSMHMPSSTNSVSNRHKNPLVFSTISSGSQDADSDDVDMRRVHDSQLH